MDADGIVTHVHTFIVRVTSADAGEVAGTVERVRTGERHRFC
jgi:hypothetical protein